MPNKPRRPWIAALLTIFAIGLGHLYAGNPRRGLILFGIGQLFKILLVSALVLVPTISTLIFIVVASFAYLAYCMVDAVSNARKNKENYELQRFNRWYAYVGYYIVVSLLVGSLVSFGIKANLLQAFKVPSGAMIPTILIGDQVLVNKFIYHTSEPRRGDIVVFLYPEDPSRTFIKRLIAVGGDTVQGINKKIYVNGKPMDEPFTQHTDTTLYLGYLEPRDNFGPYIIPKDKFFVMGDNRDQSYDSRFWGYVDVKQVKGKALIVYWSWDHLANEVRWDRIGMELK